MSLPRTPSATELAKALRSQPAHMTAKTGFMVAGKTTGDLDRELERLCRASQQDGPQAYALGYALYRAGQNIDAPNILPNLLTQATAAATAQAAKGAQPLMQPQRQRALFPGQGKGGGTGAAGGGGRGGLGGDTGRGADARRGGHAGHGSSNTLVMIAVSPAHVYFRQEAPARAGRRRRLWHGGLVLLCHTAVTVAPQGDAAEP